MAKHGMDIARTIAAYDEIAAEFADRTWSLPLDEMRQEFLTSLEVHRPAASLCILDNGRVFVSVKEGEGDRLSSDQSAAYGRRYFSYTREEELRLLLEEAGFRVLTLRRTPGEPGHDWLQAHAEARNRPLPLPIGFPS